MTSSDSQKKTFYLVPYRDHHSSYRLYGITWRAWAQGPSFYLVSRHTINDRKISLHGPNPRYPDSSWFKIALDRTSDTSERVQRSVPLPYGNRDETKVITFPGRRVNKRALHVVRLRWTPDLFKVGAPPGAGPGDVKMRKTLAVGVLAAPPLGQALDVDFFLSNGSPYVPRRSKAERDNAIFGPIYNSIGQSLTAVVYRTSLKRNPTPEPLGGDQVPAPTSVWSTVRALQMFPHPHGHLHVQERLVPR